jgi:hypothetical protein
MTKLANTVRVPRAITTTTLRNKRAGQGTEPCDLDTLRSLLDYCPETGAMVWRPRPRDKAFTTQFAGKPAMTAPLDRKRPTKGRHGHVAGAYVVAHRVAFALANGRWPKGTVVARNEDLSDTRADNLVECTWSFKMQRGAKKPRKDNSSGVPGVSFDHHSGMWKAYIMVAGRNHHLGRFKTFEAAVAARKAAEKVFQVSSKDIARMLHQEAPVHA